MEIIGTPQGVSLPQVSVMIGGANIPATSFSCQYAAGQIAIARCGILPQHLKDIPDAATRELCVVSAMDVRSGGISTLFTGYLSGISGRRGGKSFQAGVDLIHVARDLDIMRFGAPGLHPSGAQDFRYSRFAGDDKEKKKDEGPFGMGGKFYSGGNIVSEVLAGVIKRLRMMESIGSKSNTGGLTFRQESLEGCINLLQSIIVKGGDLNPGYASTVSHEINTNFVAKLNNSFTSQASVWDALNAVFSEFGILFLCMPDGTVVATPDTSGLYAPASNFIGGDHIVSFEHNSQFYRNIGGVDLLSSHPTPASLYDSTNVANALVASYYPPDQNDGASFVLNAPSFLNPLAMYSQEPETADLVPPSPGNLSDKTNQSSAPGSGGQFSEAKMRFAQMKTDYAQMIYFIERNKTRTFAATTPLMPKVFPGTTCMIQPYSTAKVRSPIEDGGIGDGQIFHGYCYSVSHNIDAKAKICSTSLQFRNVAAAYEVRGSAHPLYSGWKPIPWS